MDEPGLEEVVRKTVEEKNLGATLKPEAAIPGSHFIIICVPTPVDATKSPNYHAVETASRTVGKLLTQGKHRDSREHRGSGRGRGPRRLDHRARVGAQGGPGLRSRELSGAVGPRKHNEEHARGPQDNRLRRPEVRSARRRPLRRRVSGSRSSR